MAEKNENDARKAAPLHGNWNVSVDQPVQRYENDKVDEPVQRYEEDDVPVERYESDDVPVERYESDGVPVERYDNKTNERRQPPQFIQLGRPLPRYGEPEVISRVINVNEPENVYGGDYGRNEYEYESMLPFLGYAEKRSGGGKESLIQSFCFAGGK